MVGFQSTSEIPKHKTARSAVVITQSNLKDKIAEKILITIVDDIISCRIG